MNVKELVISFLIAGIVACSIILTVAFSVNFDKVLEIVKDVDLYMDNRIKSYTKGDTITYLEYEYSEIYTPVIVVHNDTLAKVIYAKHLWRYYDKIEAIVYEKIR